MITLSDDSVEAAGVEVLVGISKNLTEDEIARAAASAYQALTETEKGPATLSGAGPSQQGKERPRSRKAPARTAG